MSIRSFLSGAASVLMLCSLTSAAGDWTVYLRRAGPVQIGMSLAQVRRVLRDPQARLVGNTPEVRLSECAYLETKAVPKSLGIMFAKGRVVRVDVFDVGIRTARGAGVGDTESEIKRVYPGRITVEPHHYDPRGHCLRYSPSGNVERGYGIVFETDGEKVTSYRSGTLAAIALVEGCS